MRRALTIAGSDSGGGAGIQADLKTFHQFGVFGTSALSLVTAQNTLGVQGVHLLPAEVLAQQITSVVGDLPPHATKTGALGSPAIIRTVAEEIRRLGVAPLVVDPVMISKHGDRLLEEEAVRALVQHLLPLATIVTPNLHEARALLSMEIETVAQMEEAAKRLGAMGPSAVVVKGGALPGEDAVDVLWDGKEISRLRARRVSTQNTHGTGCTFSAAITAGLALGRPLHAAVHGAKRYTSQAIEGARKLGGGVGPVDHWAKAEVGAEAGG